MVTLAYPYASPTITVTLRNPELGDVQRVDLNILNRRSLGGQLHQAGLWEDNTILVLSFTEITQTQKDSLVNLFASCRGKPIKYTDYNSVAHEGIILTEDVIFNTIPNIICPRYSFSIDIAII